MNHKIRPVDLKPGNLIIVSEWYEETMKKDNQEPESYWAPKRTRKPVGDPMKVLALALPYVTVLVIQHDQRGVLDTRECEFILVDKNYVKSLVPGYGNKTPKRSKSALPEGAQSKEVYFAKGSVWKTIVEDKES